MLKRRTKIGLILASLVVLSQVPFLYRHIQIRRLSDRIAELNRNQKDHRASRHDDYAGVLHVHTSLGGHSMATLEELIEGSKGLDYVVVTEHTANLVDTAALTLNGTFNGTLFVGGNELDTHSSDRFLLIPGTREAYLRRNTETPEFLPPFQHEGRLAFVTYPERFNSWTTSNFDGVEVFNLSTSSRGVNYVLFIFDMLWAYRNHADLALATHLSRPDGNLEMYDEAAKRRRITLFAGSDAHSNIGFHILGDETGKKVLSFKLDDYAAVFRVVRTHVLLETGKPLTRESLLEALRQGHCFVGFDILGETQGFSFSAGAKIQGDEVNLAETPGLHITTPAEARIVLLKDGIPISETKSATKLVFHPKEPGAYRVEVFLDSLGKPFDRMPWILSNPIYVK
ncbi:MAG TPA: hypothetical protein VFR18_01630 [Terriglobia bacterium]|nr:hypothetical protein [Terriglobia bacterium]